MTSAPRAISVLASLWETDRSLSVLAGFLAFVIFAIVPFAEQDGTSVLVLEVSFALFLVSGTAAVARTRGWLTFLLPIAVLTACARAAAVLYPHEVSLVARPAISLLFCALLLVVVSERVLRAGAITVHRILGAVAVYLLIGVIWAQAYALVAHADPAAFAHPVPHEPHDLAPLLYYSFATLTTVGYGDVLAVHPLARSLAMLEAVIGQLYSAILVARLVGLSLQRS
jgi:hypothetical protein